MIGLQIYPKYDVFEKRNINPWVPRNPRIFQQVCKEPTKFEIGKLSLSGEAKIRNPRIGIPNVNPD